MPFKIIDSIFGKENSAVPTFISLDLKNGVIIDKFQKLIDFTDKSINLVAYNRNVYIYGENLRITSYSKAMIYITGAVHKIEIFEVK